MCPDLCSQERCATAAAQHPPQLRELGCKEHHIHTLLLTLCQRLIPESPHILQQLQSQHASARQCPCQRNSAYINNAMEKIWRKMDRRQMPQCAGPGLDVLESPASPSSCKGMVCFTPCTLLPPAPTCCGTAVLPAASPQWMLQHVCPCLSLRQPHLEAPAAASSTLHIRFQVLG